VEMKTYTCVCVCVCALGGKGGVAELHDVLDGEKCGCSQCISTMQ
jgi:hypothetical protein